MDVLSKSSTQITYKALETTLYCRLFFRRNLNGIVRRQTRYLECVAPRKFQLRSGKRVGGVRSTCRCHGRREEDRTHRDARAVPVVVTRSKRRQHHIVANQLYITAVAVVSSRERKCLDKTHAKTYTHTPKPNESTRDNV